jgi:hypothetical protein
LFFCGVHQKEAYIGVRCLFGKAKSVSLVLSLVYLV